MREIGGYFGLELHAAGDHYHDTPHRLKSGRAALRHILDHIAPTLVYVPYYTCDSLLEAFRVTGVPYRFYGLNKQLEPAMQTELKPGEYLVYINYFGLKDDAVNRLSAQYGDRLIADCTQSFFTRGNSTSWYFNSCRKFFGVPDGAYLCAPAGVQLTAIGSPNKHYTTGHLVKRLSGHTKEGYPDFVQNEEMMDCNIAAMSVLTEQLMRGIPYVDVIARRRENYAYLHQLLQAKNLFDAALSNARIPMCYPFLPANSIDRSVLATDEIFIPTFWKEVLQRSEGFELEKHITSHLLPLPIDHRYSIKDMERLANAVLKITEKRQ